MEHPGFFKRAGPFTLAEVAKATGAELAPGAASADTMIEDVRTLTDAGPRDLTFFNNRKYADRLKATNAGGLPRGAGLRRSRSRYNPKAASPPTPIAGSRRR